jgi:hypothetical protein
VDSYQNIPRELEQSNPVPVAEIEKNIENSIKMWRGYGVSEKIIREMEEFAYVVKKEEFRWSTIIIVAGRSRNLTT